MKRVFLFVLITILFASFFGCAGKEPLSPDSSTSGSTAAPPWVGYTFSYSSETDPTLNLFIDWIKSGGTKEVNGMRYDQYSYNRPFLDWVKGSNGLVLPIATNKAYRLHAVGIFYDTVSYRAVFFSDEVNTPSNEQTFNFIFTPLSETEIKQGLESLVRNFSDIEVKCGEGECPWGEYWVDVSGSGAYFLFSDYLVAVGVYTSQEERPSKWNFEYFDYFDFETVSLK